MMGARTRHVLARAALGRCRRERLDREGVGRQRRLREPRRPKEGLQRPARGCRLQRRRSLPSVRLQHNKLNHHRRRRLPRRRRRRDALAEAAAMAGDGRRRRGHSRDHDG